MHQGRQRSGDESLERSLSSQPSRRRNRSPTSTPSTSSSSENASSDCAYGGGGGQAIEEEYEDTFVPSTQFTLSGWGQRGKRSSEKLLKKQARSKEASGPAEASVSISRSASVSSGRSSALETGWSRFREGLRAFRSSSNREPHIDYGGYSQYDEDATSLPPSESNIASQPQVPNQTYSGSSCIYELPSHEEYRASDYLLPSEPPYIPTYPSPTQTGGHPAYTSDVSGYSGWNPEPASSSYPHYVMDTYADSVTNEGQQYYDDYIQQYHHVYPWHSWVFYVQRTYGIDLEALGFTDPFYQSHRHSVW